MAALMPGFLSPGSPEPLGQRTDDLNPIGGGGDPRCQRILVATGKGGCKGRESQGRAFVHGLTGEGLPRYMSIVLGDKVIV
jgi:hypothetical protein